MPKPDELIEAVARSIDASDGVPGDVSYLLQEADMDASDANVKLPVIEIELISVDRLDEFNTDESGRVLNDAGEAVGRVIRREYELSLQIDVWVAAKSSHDVNDIGQALADRLYRHEPTGFDEPLPDGNDGSISGVWDFRLGQSARRDDTTTTPSVRRWRQDVTLSSYVEYRTSGEEPLRDVSVP